MLKKRRNASEKGAQSLLWLLDPWTVRLTVIRWLLIPTVTQKKLLTDIFIAFDSWPLQPSSGRLQIILFLCIVKPIVFTVCVRVHARREKNKQKAQACPLLFFFFFSFASSLCRQPLWNGKKRTNKRRRVSKWSVMLMLSLAFYCVFEFAPSCNKHISLMFLVSLPPQ